MVETHTEPKWTKKIWALTAASFVLFAFGISIQVKARVGQSVFMAMAVTISDVSGFKVGTILNFLNLFFFGLLVLLRKRRFMKTDIIMVAATVIYGFVVNFFVYIVLGGVHPESYPLRILLMILGLGLSAGNLGVVLACGIIRFPLEAFCLVVREKIGKTLTFVRMWLDVIFLFCTLGLTFVTKNPLNIREGTVISFIMFSFVMGKSYELASKALLRTEKKEEAVG